MKTLTCCLAIALLLGIPAAEAQQVLAHSAAPPPPGSALPPPGINDPGVKPKPQSIPLPSTGIPPSIAPAAREENGHGDSTNISSTHTDANGDTIQEFSRNGSVYMVRVTPKHGVTQTYKINNPGRNAMHDPKLGPVSPVYYTIYKWGGPKKPANSAAPAQASSSG